MCCRTFMPTDSFYCTGRVRGCPLSPDCAGRLRIAQTPCELSWSKFLSLQLFFEMGLGYKFLSHTCQPEHTLVTVRSVRARCRNLTRIGVLTVTANAIPEMKWWTTPWSETPFGITGPLWGEPPITSRFPFQRPSSLKLWHFFVDR